MIRTHLAALGPVVGASLVLAACMVDSSLQSGLADGGTGGDAAPDVIVANDAPAADVGPDVPPLPICSAGVCAPPVPVGWSGPLTRYAASGPAPACPASYPTVVFEGNAGLAAPAAQCGCTCGAITGATCSATYFVYTDGACNNLCNSFAINACVSTSACNTGNSVKGTWAVSGGSCTPNPTKTVPPATWNATERACGGAMASGTGCSGSELCVPAPSGSYSRVCIGKAGDNTCPAEYPLKELLYSGVSDNRDCSACTCGGPSGATCTGGDVRIYDAPGCSGSSITVLADGTCKSAGGITTIAAKVNTAPTVSGTCAKSGGTPTGAATPTGPTTLCCR
jgi:hypothetical protein